MEPVPSWFGFYSGFGWTDGLKGNQQRMQGCRGMAGAGTQAFR